ncbi:MAG: hypothetical protein M1835_003467 [Candelina submexicana]|nr:MAG: hypothetical protein M1835_003467 [Candelina submexicana]
MATYNGRCNCGQTEWTVKLEKEQQNNILCHCNTCKQLSGSAFTLNQVVPKDAIKVTKGSPKTYTYYGDSGNSTPISNTHISIRCLTIDSLGKPVHCYYCPNCTTHVYHHQTVMGDKLITRTILLDGGDKLNPGVEIYGKARLPWQKEVAQTFETLPPS